MHISSATNIQSAVPTRPNSAVEYIVRFCIFSLTRTVSEIGNRFLIPEYGTKWNASNMWPIKNYIFYKASFTKNGEAKFAFKSKNDVPEIHGITFAIDVYSRIHSHCRPETIAHFNDFIKSLTMYSASLGVEEAIEILNKREGSAFTKLSFQMHNTQESFTYKWTGLNLASAHLVARIPYKGLESNMSFAFAHLLIHLSRNLSTESKQLISDCFAELSNNVKFTTRQYNFLNYNQIARSILSNLTSESK